MTFCSDSLRTVAKYWQTQVDSGVVVQAYHVEWILDTVAAEHLAEVLGAVDDGARLAEGEGVVWVGQLRLDGAQLVHLHGERVLLQ